MESLNLCTLPWKDWNWVVILFSAAQKGTIVSTAIEHQTLIGSTNLCQLQKFFDDRYKLMHSKIGYSLPSVSLRSSVMDRPPTVKWLVVFAQRCSRIPIGICSSVYVAYVTWLVYNPGHLWETPLRTTEKSTIAISCSFHVSLKDNSVHAWFFKDHSSWGA